MTLTILSAPLGSGLVTGSPGVFESPQHTSAINFHSTVDGEEEEVEMAEKKT